MELELSRLDEELVMLNGLLVRPGQCYRFFIEPPHVLYNTNCPEELMNKIESILLKYQPINETGL